MCVCVCVCILGQKELDYSVARVKEFCPTPSFFRPQACKWSVPRVFITILYLNAQASCKGHTILCSLGHPLYQAYNHTFVIGDSDVSSEEVNQTRKQSKMRWTAVFSLSSFLCLLPLPSQPENGVAFACFLNLINCVLLLH